MMDSSVIVVSLSNELPTESVLKRADAHTNIGIYIGIYDHDVSRIPSTSLSFLGVFPVDISEAFF